MFNNSGDLGKYLKPVDFGLGDIPVLNLTGKDAGFYRNGGFIGTDAPDGMCRVYADGVFIGIGMVTNHTLRPQRTI